jgi:hypothetical protein
LGRAGDQGATTVQIEKFERHGFLHILSRQAPLTAFMLSIT